MMQASVFVNDTDGGSFPIALSGSITGSSIWVGATNHPLVPPTQNIKAKVVMSTSLPTSIRILGNVSGAVTLDITSLVGTTLNTTITSNTLTGGETAFLRIIVIAQ